MSLGFRVFPMLSSRGFYLSAAAAGFACSHLASLEVRAEASEM